MTALSEVTTVWGDVEFRKAEPACRTFSSAIYAPMRADPGFGQDPDWGLYDAEGSVIPGAVYARGPGAQPVGQSPHRTIDRAALEVVDEEFIYGGPILLHYGHFVIASLARMWMIQRQRGTRRRILFHADTPSELWFQFDHVRTIFGALGIGPQDCVRLERPSLLRSIVVPHPSFEEQSYVCAAFEEVGRTVGRACAVHDGPRVGRPAYVSKTHLQLGINRLNEEAVMEAELERLGFEIFHPTDMPLAAQMQHLSRAKAVTGSVGSAFHTTMFFREPADIVGLCPIDNVISNFPLVDLATRSRAVYLYPTTATARDTGADARFHVTWTLADPIAVAREIAARV